ncbi:uncharacterized protein LAJ45_05345 [Morchella importuna]|uniref:Uncharacterized protein n=1 Tax=Morchella conica CCBAS932 TaxID=1392247 RepID=A0A3N4KZF2_9PEZI|nr:uncharacterized protein LAJ45_05345 [Morchella importuna]KAH8150649.1 hypothetical protein LAJ45_05345 [Morchella importuna]RPB14632.1 hypothetical protein P167DRAFT_572362 [Morchella conica CCBAS932]
MKSRASGRITENEAALSNLRGTGPAGWGSSQASASEDKIFSIEHDLLRDLHPSPLKGDQDGVHYNPGVNSTDFYPDIDFPPPPHLSHLGHQNLRVNGASFQGQASGLASCAALGAWSGDQLVSNSSHAILAAATSQASAAAVASAFPTPGSFYGSHGIQQNLQGQLYDFGDDSVGYQQPGLVYSYQRAVYPYEDHRFQPGHSFTDFLYSDESIHVLEATPVPEAIPVPKAIPTANPRKKQERKKKEEREVLPVVNVSNNNNNPAPETPEILLCHWSNCNHTKPFSKRHNLLQHRRKVHGEVIPIRRFRFGVPPPDDPTRITQQLGRRRRARAAAAAAVKAAGEE